MAKSIIQARTAPGERECYVCRQIADAYGYYGELKHTGLHKHHFIYGRMGVFRKKAEHYGLWAYVCQERHHEHGPEAPHENHEVDLWMKRIAQETFEKKYGHELWMQEFGKNYLEEPEEACGQENY